MTTHYQKIQALGNRMAENLTIMGVPSQFEEGGLTLADKILEISGRVTSGIILYADKKIAQSEDTVNLSMMVLEDGVFKTGVDVYLHDVEIFNHTYSSGASINEPIGDDWILETTGIVGIRSYEDERTLMMCGGGVVNIMVDGTTVYTNTSVSTNQFTYKDGVFSFDDETVDLSSYTQRFNFLDNIGYDGGSVSVVGPAVCTTDSHGLATYAYTCTGSGLKEFYATYGTFVSETLSVWDTKWFDDGTDSTHSMFGSSSTMTVNYGTEECTLTETTSGTTGVVVTNTNHYIQPNDVFEFDFLQVDGQRNFAIIYVRNKANGTTLSAIPHLYEIGKQLNTWIHYKCQISDNKLTVYVDDNPTPIEKTLSNTDTDYCLYWNTVPTRDNHTIKFKNFKVYSG